MRCVCIFLASLIIIAIIIIIIFISISFEVIDANEVGIAKNTFTQNIDETFLYPDGRHFIGPFTDFIHYSTLYHTLSFQKKNGDDPAVLIRANDGLEMNLEVAFQYQLNITLQSILSIYYNFDSDYKTGFISLARESIREVASKYNSMDYFESREIIANEMSDHLNIIFSKYDAQVATFQMLGFEVPDSFKNENELTQEAKQKAETMEFQKQTVIIETQTNVSKALTDSEIILSKAEAEAEATKIKADADEEIIKIEIKGEIESYKLYKEFDKTETADATDNLKTYMWLNNVKETSNKKIKVDLGNPLN